MGLFSTALRCVCAGTKTFPFLPLPVRSDSFIHCGARQQDVFTLVLPRKNQNRTCLFSYRRAVNRRAIASVPKMPSKSDACVTGEQNSTSQEFISRDVDQLVAEIKENLRLTSLKVRTKNQYHKHRTSPYSVPGRGGCDTCNSSRCGPSCSQQRRAKADSSPEDPYEMLQELIRRGSLVKEAVRRLQAGLSPKQTAFFYDLEDGHSPVAFCGVDV